MTAIGGDLQNRIGGSAESADLFRTKASFAEPSNESRSWMVLNSGTAQATRVEQFVKLDNTLQEDTLDAIVDPEMVKRLLANKSHSRAA